MREATAADHEAVEGAVPLMDAGLDRARYVAVLQRMHGVVKVWEEFALRAAPPSLLPMVVERQRLGLLEGDLLGLGADVPSGDGPVLPGWGSPGELLGAMYVMEGSRLGGQMIARHVEGLLGFSSGEGGAYFRGFGDRTGVMWKELVRVLDGVPPPQDEVVIRAAREMFAVFGGWMRGV
ncbi:biliverdin-producing heme oxygenase [Granulicella sibirica]|uniref:biliverdin-producing heme oxygenase n=1 Tax=Granulicella sibirica TaxID=2479048 RepID=UPI0010089419|nr:biliverdin-producing heme oxygenase [Granulicella sibirica]